MISWELHPFQTWGGTAYAIRRLADQLTELGIETRVLLPDRLDTHPGKDLPPLLRPMFLKMRTKVDRASRILRFSEFCQAALEAVEQIRTSAGSDTVIAHSDEAAMFTILKGKRSAEPSVFWLHSLYDPPIDDLSKDQRRLLPSTSLLASAIKMADIVVTSAGILKDAGEFEWPDRLKELQKALTIASAEHRVLTVESMGCLPAVTKNTLIDSKPEILKNVPSPYVLFPGRPSIDKGFGIFAAIAERLRADNLAFVAVHSPMRRKESENEFRNASIHWLPWLTQDELRVAMSNATCVVLPSITEGFGLAAAESISQGVATLYQQVGGHHALKELPNALPVPITANERADLYGLWSELIGSDPDSRPIWTRHEISLRPLVDKWVEAIRSVVQRANGGRGRIEDAHFPEWPLKERWANKLRRRIEVGPHSTH
jgi:glycosyltransferase involved in cell wall biosynthesis